MTSNSNLYEVLGVENDASPQEIKRAYRRLAMKVSTDIKVSIWPFIRKIRGLSGTF